MSQGNNGIRTRGMVATIAGAVVLSGCYHAVINTGIQPGPRTVEEKWAMGYIGGLVPPDPVYAEQQCGESGVARVETKHSFLNQLVAGLTFSIFTPMEIVVTCGRGPKKTLQRPRILRQYLGMPHLPGTSRSQATAATNDNRPPCVPLRRRHVRVVDPLHVGHGNAPVAAVEPARRIRRVRRRYQREVVAVDVSQCVSLEEEFHLALEE